MLFNNSTKAFDFQEFSILVTFNPDFQKKNKSHGKKNPNKQQTKKKSPWMFQFGKEFAKIAYILPNFKGKK